MQRNEFHKKVLDILEKMCNDESLGPNVILPCIAAPSMNTTNGIINDVITDGNDSHANYIVAIDSDGYCVFYRKFFDIPDPYKTRLFKVIGEYCQTPACEHDTDGSVDELKKQPIGSWEQLQNTQPKDKHWWQFWE